MSDNIKVVVKVRPLIPREIEEKQSYRWRVNTNTLHQLDQNGRETEVCFTFDKVYDKDTKTEEVYNDIAKPIVEAAIAGFNGTIFAYGQTSSGKTYTMTGTEESPGIIPLSVLNLFEKIKTIPNRDFLVRVSYIEIYNETVKDLLNVEKEKIKIHETLQGVKVDCSEKVTSSPEEVLGAMKEGEVNRQTGATNMNEESSRSHSIFQITIESREHIDGSEEEPGCVNVSQLNLVDLAGSERAGQTGATGLRFKEGTHINKSLSVLALVIKQLSEYPNKYANYRDSKLTRILQNSLGGNAKTSIICAITPASVEETISTLQFANRAKAIKNKPEVNAVATNATMIQSLTKQLSRLQAELAVKQNLEVMLESKKTVEQELQKQIATLQKLILNGFGQRSGMEFSAAGRRKPLAPRRMTISTLHHTEEDSVPAVPKFCTPSLKYNPMSMPGLSELGAAAASMGFCTLATVPEEGRMTTPPRKPAGFGDDVIEIDSDDDLPETDCSPYHKCYGSSKTPPCILRKSAKEAEKNLKEIVELTQREKIYTPAAVELIEKWEQSSTTIALLQDQVNTLEDKIKEKDLLIENLNHKITKTEQENQAIVAAKSRLEVECNQKDILLTDLEVIRDTLKKQAKNRESELLSLLAEQRQLYDMSKILKPTEKESLNFMDMSKDISLVNSDNETSMIHGNEEGALTLTSSRMQDLVSDVRAELAAKNKTIVSLEENIMTQKNNIETLESAKQQLQQTIDDLTNKLSTVETESMFLKGTIETLNTTVENQKQSLESAKKDIQSYNSTIQELLIKLNNKDDILNCKFSDSMLESLIDTEQKIIANNDNLKNIIHLFRMKLDKKSEELDSFNARLSDNNANLKKHIEMKENQITSLIEEAEKLNIQLNENMIVINKLVEVEKDHSSQISSLQEQNKALQAINEENAVLIANYNLYKSEYDKEIENLKKDNSELIRTVEEKELDGKSIFSKLNEQTKQVDDMAQRIRNLEEDLIASQLNSEKLSQLLAEKEILLDQIYVLECNLAEKIDINNELSLRQIKLEDNEKNTRDKNVELSLIIETLNKRVYDLEQDISEKDKLLATERDKIIEANEARVKQLALVFSKVDKILSKLGSETHNSSDVIPDNGDVFNLFNTKTNEWDLLVNEALQKCLVLEEQRNKIENNYHTEVQTLQSKMELLQNDMKHDAMKLSQQVAQMTKALEETLKVQEEKEKVVSQKTKMLLIKLDNILMTLSGSSEEGILTNDEPECVFENFENKLSALGNLVDIIIGAREDLQHKMKTLVETHEVDLRLLHSQIKNSNCLILQQAEELKQYNITKSQEELQKGNKDLDCKKCFELETKLGSAEKCIENLQAELAIKDNEIILLKSVDESIRLDIGSLKTKNIDIESKLLSSKEKYEYMLKEKNVQIDALNVEISNLVKENQKCNEKLDFINSDILRKISRICVQCGIEQGDDVTNSNIDIRYHCAAFALDKVFLHIDLLKTENEVERSDIEAMLREARNEIVNLTAQHLNLMNAHDDINSQNLKLLQELQEVKKVNINLLDTSALLKDLNIELQSKNHEIKIMEDKAVMWREQFLKYENTVQQEIRELVAANNKLQSIVASQFSRAVSPNKNDIATEILKTNTPQTLVSICCNKIIDYIQHSYSESTSLTTTSSKSSISIRNSKTQTDSNECNCSELSYELKRVTDQNLKLVEDLSEMSLLNSKLIDLSNDLQASNNLLLREGEMVRKEIEMLVEPANELQKKIAKHRTNLSTLTATTYAENKLLNSQLRVLNHHHTRYIHLCQRDLPDVKNQLKELMTLLKKCTCSHKQNPSPKRYSLPDVLDSNTSTSTLKHESTLDGDLLMLDTNVTLTTANNTLVGPDQTCLEITLNENDVSCPTNDSKISKMIDPYLIYSQIETLTSDNEKLVRQIDALKEENVKLKINLDKFGKDHSKYTDAQTSPAKMIKTNDCKFCNKTAEELQTIKDKFSETINVMTNKLQETIQEKDNMELKLSNTEKEINSKTLEIRKLTTDLNKKNKVMKELQEENNTLSMQIMDNISEADSLKKELDNLKYAQIKLTDIHQSVKHDISTNTTDIQQLQSDLKTEFTKTIQDHPTDQPKLNRSFSESESSSRHIKICTLQNELHASKEDCKKITEEVVTIKNHLERSNISMSTAMDLDESAGDANIFAITRDLNTAGDLNTANNMEYNINDYIQEKRDCLQFYMDRIGSEKENVGTDIKIIDIMKRLYNDLLVKHSNEVENLSNKLRDFEDTHRRLKTQLAEVNSKNEDVSRELKTNSTEIITIGDTLNKIRENINVLNQEMFNIMDSEKNTVIVKYFKENLLQLIDSEFGLSCVNIFNKIIDCVVEKHQKDLSSIIEKYTNLQNNMENVVEDFNNVNENLKQIKQQLSVKENEYNLLKAQKERIHEISNAVTLDIVYKEKELTETLVKGYEKLAEQGLVSATTDVDLPMNEKINMLFDFVMKETHNKLDLSKEKTNLILELDTLKTSLNEKEKAIVLLHEEKTQKDKVIEHLQMESQIMLAETNKIKIELQEKEKNEEILVNKMSEADKTLQKQKELHEGVVNLYESRIEENNVYLQRLLAELATVKSQSNVEEDLYKEIEKLREDILERETTIARLESQVTLQNDPNLTSAPCLLCPKLLEQVETLNKEFQNLKSVNSMIIKEKDTYALELENAKEIIAKNKGELEKMTSDILVLRESIKDNVSIIDTLTAEAKVLVEQNAQLKKQFEQRHEDCLRLEVNIKTHEKTAQIQSKMIIRLQKQKEEDDRSLAEKDRQINELTSNCVSLRKECEGIKSQLETAKKDIEILNNKKESLEEFVECETEWSEGAQPRRQSLEAGGGGGSAEAARRRRQSLHDSQRAIDDIEAVFGARGSPRDLFGGAGSAAPSPGLSESGGSVSQARRRRQSLHDQRRRTRSPAPAPAAASAAPGEAALRESLAAAHAELAELRERCRELDEECETCAQYLREREEQCRRLRRDYAALEQRLAERALRPLPAPEGARSVHAAVNTDEDWANLHSVVVDRMSFDAEVEKNKKLSRTIEELRCNKQELKATVAKLQRALERGGPGGGGGGGARSAADLEAELAESRRRLAELAARCRELDEECETCAQYLRERDDQCRKLREAKQALEAKLQELTGESEAGAAARRRRQTAHDHNRTSSAQEPPADAHTQVTDDFLYCQVERDDNAQKNNQAQTELNRVKKVLEKVLREKATLENQLMAAMPAPFNPTMYVATGSAIVQNQQITDVMRENQKLKKLNAKLVSICKKRGKVQDSNQENEDPADLG